MSKQSAARRFDATQLMVLGRGAPEFGTFARFEEYLRPGDLLVMNLSGTLPGSIWVRKGSEGFELRLAAFAGDSLRGLREWWAVSFGAGDWRQPTEERGPPPKLRPGDILATDSGLRMEVLAVDADQPRLLRLSFLGEDFLPALYASARPIQYSYQAEELALWDVQTPLAQLPLSVEAPSALFPFRWEKLLALKRKCALAFLYHGAGLSSTGDAGLDAHLPLPEFFSIPARTVEAWRHARERGGRVIAVGTSAARALESAKGISGGEARRIEGVTDLRINASRQLRRVDGLLTGYHEPLTSHFELESAFVREEELRAGFREAEKRGFRRHEFGDSTLLLRH
jgi:S-adenosylmethionine:tRNA ribosyltransferase-isomerase